MTQLSISPKNFSVVGDDKKAIVLRLLFLIFEVILIDKSLQNII